MTIALAPAKRVTTAAVRPPCVVSAGCPAAPPPVLFCGAGVWPKPDCAIGPVLVAVPVPDAVLPKFDRLSGVELGWSGVWPTSCWSTGNSCSASAFSRNTTLISVPFFARASRSSATWARRATVPGSPRSATAFEPSTATTDTVAPDATPPPLAEPLPLNPCNAAATSRAPALRSAITRVDALSVSTRRNTSRTLRTLSAKSTTTSELPARLALTDPCWLTSGRTVSSADCASTERSRMISVTKLLRLAPLEPIRLGCCAALSSGWMRSAPVAVGTAIRLLARSVDRNTSKYSERDSGRSVTTVTLPVTRLSMMNVRPVTLAASAMKARISASRTLSVVWATAPDASATTAIGASSRLMASVRPSAPG